MSKIIGGSIATALILIATIFIVSLYLKSTERKQFLAGMGLTALTVICLEILLLQA